MKVIVAGGRDFSNYPLMKRILDLLLSNINEDIEIVSGRAKGADSLGELYGEENSFKIKYFPANWDLYGKRAGYLRNEEMAKYADACVCFWDGRSRGTKHMIDLAEKYRLKLRIINY